MSLKAEIDAAVKAIEDLKLTIEIGGINVPGINVPLPFERVIRLIALAAIRAAEDVRAAQEVSSTE